MIVRGKVSKIFFISLLMILATTHIMHIIIAGISLNQITLPICIIFAIAVKTENRHFYSYGFLVTGIFNILTLPELANLSPFIFLFLSVYYQPKNIIKFLTPAIIICSFVISYHINDFNNYINLIEGISGNISFLVIFYFLFIKKPEDINILSKITPLTKRQLLILKCLAMDIPRKQIPASVKDSTLWRLDLDRDKFTVDIINTEIAKIKKVLELTNEMCLGIWYNKQVEITNNSRI